MIKLLVLLLFAHCVASQTLESISEQLTRIEGKIDVLSADDEIIMERNEEIYSALNSTLFGQNNSLQTILNLTGSNVKSISDLAGFARSIVSTPNYTQFSGRYADTGYCVVPFMNLVQYVDAHGFKRNHWRIDTSKKGILFIRTDEGVFPFSEWDPSALLKTKWDGVVYSAKAMNVSSSYNFSCESSKRSEMRLERVTEFSSSYENIDPSLRAFFRRDRLYTSFTQVGSFVWTYREVKYSLPYEDRVAQVCSISPTHTLSGDREMIVEIGLKNGEFTCPRYPNYVCNESCDASSSFVAQFKINSGSMYGFGNLLWSSIEGGNNYYQPYFNFVQPWLTDDTRVEYNKDVAVRLRYATTNQWDFDTEHLGTHFNTVECDLEALVFCRALNASYQLGMFLSIETGSSSCVRIEDGNVTESPCSGSRLQLVCGVLIETSSTTVSTSTTDTPATTTTTSTTDAPTTSTTMTTTTTETSTTTDIPGPPPTTTTGGQTGDTINGCCGNSYFSLIPIGSDKYFVYANINHGTSYPATIDETNVDPGFLCARQGLPHNPGSYETYTYGGTETYMTCDYFSSGGSAPCTSSTTSGSLAYILACPP